MEDSPQAPTPHTIFGAPAELVLERASLMRGQQAFLVDALQVQLEASRVRIRALEEQLGTLTASKEATP